MDGHRAGPAGGARYVLDRLLIPTVLLWGALAAAGALGAVTRYLIGGAIQGRSRGSFPWGTMAVNVSGSLLLGVMLGLSREQAAGWGPFVVVGIGFCGAYTTFSTFTIETVVLAEAGRYRAAVTNVLACTGAAMAAVVIGIMIGSRL